MKKTATKCASCGGKTKMGTGGTAKKKMMAGGATKKKYAMAGTTIGDPTDPGRPGKGNCRMGQCAPGMRGTKGIKLKNNNKAFRKG
jgi:hypothetical protein